MRRGPRGEGSVYQRKADGRWVATVFLGHHQGTGVRVRRAFYADTQKEALAKRKRYLRDLEDGVAAPTSSRGRKRYTVGEWLDYWLDHVVAPEREPTTFDSYRDVINNHIKPHLGRVPLAELQTEQVEHWLKTLRDKPVGLRTRQQALTRLRTALSEALARKQQTGVRFNAATLAKMPSGPKKKVAPPNPDHARALLDAARGKPLEAMVIVALGLGLRRGEVLGLRWSDVDFDARSVTIRRRVSRVSGEPLLVREGSKMHPDQQETIAAPDMVMDALDAHRERQARDRLPVGYVFVSNSGTVVDPRNASRFFEGVRARAGLPTKTLHQLRHDFASLLLAEGVPLWIVSKILRHKNIQVTSDYYAHLVPELHRDAADRMNDVLRRLGQG